MDDYTSFFFSQQKWGVPKIHIVTGITSKPGLKALVQAHPDVQVTVGMIDDGLTKDGMVIPGMGDVGDRLFGTGNCERLVGILYSWTDNKARTNQNLRHEPTRIAHSIKLHIL